VVRAALARHAGDVEIVAVNDPGATDVLAHLLTFDSLHGRLQAAVRTRGERIEVGELSIATFHERDPGRLPWADLGIDCVIEATGRFTTRESASQHLASGAARVLVSAPCRDADITICMGVNDHLFDPSRHVVVSNASCTTNCLAVMLTVLHRHFGVEWAFATTVHAYTNDQRLLDGGHSDLRRARAAALNIIPTRTGAGRALAEVMPELAGRVDGLALRVPVPDGSVTDLVCGLRTSPDRSDVDDAFAAAVAGPMKNVLGYARWPLVSGDIVGDPHSCVYAAGDTVVRGHQVKVLGWYDNEWAYANRLLEAASLLTRPSRHYHSENPDSQNAELASGPRLSVRSL